VIQPKPVPVKLRLEVAPAFGLTRYVPPLAEVDTAPFQVSYVTLVEESWVVVNPTTKASTLS
jgi:hypothetical protein